jgi:hypothetical protein
VSIERKEQRDLQEEKAKKRKSAKDDVAIP